MFDWQRRLLPYNVYTSKHINIQTYKLIAQDRWKSIFKRRWVILFQVRWGVEENVCLLREHNSWTVCLCVNMFVCVCAIPISLMHAPLVKAFADWPIFYLFHVALTCWLAVWQSSHVFRQWGGRSDFDSLRILRCIFCNMFLLEFYLYMYVICTMQI